MPKESTNQRAVWASRIAFLTCLLLVAALFGFAAFRIVQNGETRLANKQFESIAERALTSVKSNAYKNHQGTRALADVVAHMLPDPDAFPLVAVPGFERIANSILDTSGGREMAFLPIITHDQINEFEEFAYSYYATRFPNETVAISSFGKGIWAGDGTLNTSDARYHVADPEYPLSNFYTPMLQHNAGIFPALLLDVQAESSTRQQMDQVLQCVAEGHEYCGTITDIVTLRGQPPGTGPAAVVMEPIRPIMDPSVVTGFLASTVVFDEILALIFSKTVSGIDCVLETGNSVYTYTVYNGVAIAKNFGDDHNTKYDSYRRSIRFSSHDYLEGSPEYQLSLYPNELFFSSVYSTENPLAATIGAVCTILFTSVLFIIYDAFVRREFSAKQQMLEARRHFVRFISHEVRTPLNSVCMGISLLQEDFRGLKQRDLERKKRDSADYGVDQGLENISNGAESHINPTEWLAISDCIFTNAKSAIEVLNDLLNYDKVEAGTLSLELSKIRIWSLVESVFNEFITVASKKQIHFSLDVAQDEENQEIDVEAHHLGARYAGMLNEATIIGDHLKLRQVMRNLMSNALKFTPNGRCVRIEVQCSPVEPNTHEFVLKGGEAIRLNQSGTFVLSVIDNGVGMSHDQLSQLFLDGMQFNANRLQAGQGSGLGLFISKGIIDSHKGSLTAASEGLQRGSSFTVSLPTYRVSDSELNASESSEVPSTLKKQKSRRILVVDDSATNRKLLIKMLQRSGHVCFEAADGISAVNILKDPDGSSTNLDTIVMDYDMPRMTGPEAVTRIRKDGYDGYIVGLTGNAFAEAIEEFLSSGTDIVLHKPFSMLSLNKFWENVGSESTTP